MQLKLAMVKVAVDQGFISRDEGLRIAGEISNLSVAELATMVNIGPLPDDHPELVVAIERAIADNPRAVADYRAGRERAINRVMGQVMRATGGRNDAGQLLDVVRRRVTEAGR